jgi:hypothetical protein
MPLLQIIELCGSLYVFRVSKCWTVVREETRIMETAEIPLFRAAVEYRMADRKRKEDVRE